MRLVSTFAHGVCDYLIGLTLLIGIPFTGLAAGDRLDMLVPEAIGLAVLLNALVTHYELGALRLVPMPLHLAIDAAAGVLLACSPWLFQFSHAPTISWAPHVLTGAALVMLAICTAPTGGRVRVRA